MRRALGPLVFLVSVACAPAGGTAALEQHLRACGLLSDGVVVGSLSPFYVPNDCYASCLASASCEDLAGRLCGTSLEVARRCDEQCAHRCADGSLAIPEARCDGFDDCPDRSDEVGCPVFVCANGVTLPLVSQCNGYRECAEGDDERGCPSHDCTSVEGDFQIHFDPWYRCDGRRDCASGEDERGCAQLTCDDGMIVTRAPGSVIRCDGIDDCAYDGSDERGCPPRAELTPHCL